MAKILIADDDQTIIGFVQIVLEAQGHQVMSARDGQEALARFDEVSPDLVILDIMMPKMSGLDVCSILRDKAPLLPIIMLTAKQQVQDLVTGLHSGADDYVTKPFKRQELVARIEAALRRHELIQSQTQNRTRQLQVGGLVVDLNTREVAFENQAMDLSRTEFRLLQVFCEYADQVLEREQLLRQVWGYRIAGQSRTVDNFVGRVRRKLSQAVKAQNRALPRIESIYGVGYRMLTREQRSEQDKSPQGSNNPGQTSDS